MSTTHSYVKYAQEHANKAYQFQLPAGAQAALQGLKVVVPEHDGGPEEDSRKFEAHRKKAH